MNITKEQQQAIEDYAKDAMDYFIVRHWHHDYMVGIKAGMQEVLNNPEKYGLVNWQRGGNTVIPTVEYKNLIGEVSDLKQYIFSCKTDKENQVDVDIQFLKEMKDRLNKSLTDPTQIEYLHNMISDWINQLEKQNL